MLKKVSVLAILVVFLFSSFGLSADECIFEENCNGNCEAADVAQGMTEGECPDSVEDIVKIDNFRYYENLESEGSRYIISIDVENMKDEVVTIPEFKLLGDGFARKYEYGISLGVGETRTIHFIESMYHITFEKECGQKITLGFVETKDGVYDHMNKVIALTTEELKCETVTCVDSDGGLNYYEKSYPTGLSPTGTVLDDQEDDCFTVMAEGPQEEGPKVFEYYCEEGFLKTKIYTCPEGCVDGICVGSVETVAVDITDTETISNVTSTVTIEVPEGETITVGTQCGGCTSSGFCLPIGTRFLEDGLQYCDIDGSFQDQQETGEECQNNYECLTNFCSNGACFDIEGELKETKGVLRQIVDFLSGMFGNIFG